MTYITKTKDRTLAFATEQVQGTEWLVLIERERYLPSGYVNHKWTEQRITIHAGELRKLAEKLKP